MIEIDGSEGEGGGQVLRTALVLALVTQKRFVITNIRANRRDPGLKRQHLACVRGAAEISDAYIEGAQTRSLRLLFEPHAVKSGRYRFDIGTAGSVSLLLQALWLPLALCKELSQLHLTGGTHVQWAPLFHYLDKQFVPTVREMGYNLSLELVQAGYYPRGGGELRARVEPTEKTSPIALTTRGEVQQVEVQTFISNLKQSIAERMQGRARKLFREEGIEADFRNAVLPSIDSGCGILITGEFAGGRCCFSTLGAPGKRAEQVAEETVTQFLSFLKSPAAIDVYLADQILLPAALASDLSSFTTTHLSQHLATNAQIIEKFLPVRFRFSDTSDGKSVLCEVQKPG